jgi:hypothetical protein
VRCLVEQRRDLQLRLTEDDPRRFSSVACVSRDICVPAGSPGDDDVAHPRRLHRHPPRHATGVDQRLAIALDPLAAVQQIGERRPAEDVAQRILRRPARRLRIVLHLECRALGGL